MPLFNMHIQDYKRAQSVMKIHKKNQVYFYKGKIYLKKSEAPKEAETVKREENG